MARKALTVMSSCPISAATSFKSLREEQHLSPGNLDGPINALNTIVDGVKDYLPTAAFQPWLMASLDEILVQSGRISSASAESLVNLLLSSNDLTWIEKIFTPALCNHLDQSNPEIFFALATALSVSLDQEPKDLAKQVCVAVLRGVAPSAIESTRLPKDPPKPKRTSYTFRNRHRHERSPTPEENDLKANLCLLHQLLLGCGLKDEARLLLQHVEQECQSSMHPAYFDTLVLPYLDRVIGLRRLDEVLLPEDLKFAERIIRIYQFRSTGPEPLPPTDWSRPLLASLCLCSTCKQLRDFIISPQRQRMEFTAIFKVRQHVEKVLGDDYDTVVHKNSTPHTLEVIKTTRYWARSLRDWQANSRVVEAKAKSFFERTRYCNITWKASLEFFQRRGCP
ncbi:uncharacterized protein RCC_11407 [Ramularia collo-cygni]|uniref:Uncharacterized protein n=1 Tax=Ramularia collo-cygni TaxID=112498 RepID=A0A2D3VC37_9PEZI|nr:uncharacterized protein RCC_11407 [Ramularia collo-cygni]CZT25738.1 uncharacterized protein RCC_11407 [Ramularia collo-cygni]